MRELHVMEIVLPRHSNHYGTLFGPQAMALLGKVAFLAATRFCSQSVVMASCRVDFLVPVPIGAVLDLHAQVTRVGRSSLSIDVVAALTYAAEKIPTALRGSFEMVVVDASGRPTPIAERVPADTQPQTHFA